jgi:predicted nucleotide-binding protein
MICVPIITVPGEPFGVVCFHNNDPQKEFSATEIDALEAYVDVLAIALHNPLPELNLEKNVFIVHGRDHAALNELQLLLIKHQVTPKVLLNTHKGPNSILEELEALIRICKAGFILMTPDDEGRLSGSQDALAARARENVIFETGMLFAKYRKFERVTLLVKEPLRLPSDLDGINKERFSQSVWELETAITDALAGWNIAPLTRAQAVTSRS